MRSTKPSVPRWVALILAVPVLLVGGLLAPSAAQAAPAGLRAADASTAIALSDKLGAKSGGAYLDAATGRMVVAVTDDAAAATVRAAGGIAKVVRYSAADLARVTATIEQSAAVVGTARAVDPVTNQVVVTVDSTVTGAKLAAVRAAVAAAGDAARLERTAGVFSLQIAGGQAIYAGGGGRCSLGFNVRNREHTSTSSPPGTAPTSRRPGTPTPARRPSSAPGRAPASPATTTGSSATPTPASPTRRRLPVPRQPGHHHPPAPPFVGQSVRRSGSTTGVRSGTVNAAQRDRQLRAGHRPRADPDQRLRRARRQRRLALRRQHRRSA